MLHPQVTSGNLCRFTSCRWGRDTNKPSHWLPLGPLEAAKCKKHMSNFCCLPAPQALRASRGSRAHGSRMMAKLRCSSAGAPEPPLLRRPKRCWQAAAGQAQRFPASVQSQSAGCFVSHFTLGKAGKGASRAQKTLRIIGADMAYCRGYAGWTNVSGQWTRPTWAQCPMPLGNLSPRCAVLGRQQKV